MPLPIIVEQQHGSSDASETSSLCSDSSSELSHHAVDAFAEEERGNRRDSLTGWRGVHFYFLPSDLYSGCNPVGRAMCQFSRSITSKDISSIASLVGKSIVFFAMNSTSVGQPGSCTICIQAPRLHVSMLAHRLDSVWNK